MDRIVQQRHVGGHDVAIVETLADEGSGYLLLVDGLLADLEPLGRMPTDEELLLLLKRLSPG